MTVQVLGCSHKNAPVVVRERLAFSPDQTLSALESLKRHFPSVEAVLLSTCNRVELYLASDAQELPSSHQVAEFLGRFHGVEPFEVLDHLYEQTDRDAIYHLFVVASSLDSIVVGEPQILSQVKQAYKHATHQKATGPLTHAAFQAATRVARRVATETTIHRRRVSIPSVAVADFAKQIFERFDDKRTLVIGAGEMAEETLRYLQDEGATDVTVINRNKLKATEVALRWQGKVREWDALFDALEMADLVISTTSSPEPIVTREQFQVIEAQRDSRPLFILDLAVPRDFDSAIGEFTNTFLYSVDDLQAVCDRNRSERDRELPKAQKIIEREVDRFMADLHHRATGPIIQRLREGWQIPKEMELDRLFNKLPDLDDHARDEIRQSFDRLVGKLLHPPLSSLREESRQGNPHRLLGALARLFQLPE